MVDELYLIAHKVRGLPAFDIATHMTCPVCDATNDHCPSCDGVGHWWIIPTSGHRAYPYASCIMLCHEDTSISFKFPPGLPDSPPLSLRDHYTSEAETARSLIDTLGLKATTVPPPPLVRRL